MKQTTTHTPGATGAETSVLSTFSEDRKENHSHLTVDAVENQGNSCARTVLQKVKRALLAGVDVSTVWALGEGFGVRLAARIHTLRKRGWPIITQCGSDRIAHYSLPEGWTIADLKEVTDAV